MRYKFLIFAIVFFVCILVFMETNKSFQAKVLWVSDYVKMFFIDSKSNIVELYERHFDQANQIEMLTDKVRDYDKLLLEISSLKSDLIKYNQLIGGGGITRSSSEIHPARIVSFAALGERDRIWLDSDMSRFSTSVPLEQRIFGIVKDNVAIGVAIFQDGRLEGFLNSSTQCHYDVYIGESRVMGIASGNGKGVMIVDFIPDWVEIKKGDKVFTSGLDGIFLENIPVGEVQEVSKNYGYISAKVAPYTSVVSLSNVWLIDKLGFGLMSQGGAMLDENENAHSPNQGEKEAQEDIDNSLKALEP